MFPTLFHLQPTIDFNSLPKTGFTQAHLKLISEEGMRANGMAFFAVLSISVIAFPRLAQNAFASISKSALTLAPDTNTPPALVFANMKLSGPVAIGPLEAQPISDIDAAHINKIFFIFFLVRHLNVPWEHREGRRWLFIDYK